VNEEEKQFKSFLTEERERRFNEILPSLYTFANEELSEMRC
jgi:hypothetical protein